MENVETQGLAHGPQTVGNQLRAAREAAGKTRADISFQTKIAERHLISIEEDRLGDLAGRAYAVGFARSFARAVGLDEQAIAARVREQFHSEAPERPEVRPSFEPGDPARVPTRRLAWVAAIGVIVAVGLLLAFWSNFLSPEGKLPDLIAQEQAAAPAGAPSPDIGQAPAPAPPPNGPVVLTAMRDQVWVKVTDAAGVQVMQKQLAQGENWTAPEGVTGLQLRTGRPDALLITVGGKAIAPLADEPRLVSGVSLDPADLMARANPGGGPVGDTRSLPSIAPAPSPQASGPSPQTSPAPPSRAAGAASRPTAAPTRRPVRPASTPAPRAPREVPTPESLLPPSLSTTSP